MADLPKILIVDLGSQYTLVIERTLRELGFRSVILEPKRAAKWLTQHPDVKAVILSGGPSSVYDKDAPQPPVSVLGLKQLDGWPTPVLGICYGMQWLAHTLDGKVEAAADKREYGSASIYSEPESPLFANTPCEQRVWASHGDSVVALPKGFTTIARTDHGGIAAMEDVRRRLWGVQFHPEVLDTPSGKDILRNFVETIAYCRPDWTPSSMVDDICQQVLTSVGNGKVILGFSGGVDSTAIARILAPILGDRLLAVTIDAGNLRMDELDEIRAHAKAAGVTHQVIDAKQKFLKAFGRRLGLWASMRLALWTVLFAIGIDWKWLASVRPVTDAEVKRRIFKRCYQEVLADAGEKFGATFIIQGTLATDRIESGATGGDLIKSHHNVGGIFRLLQQLHPVAHLFKYEVRALAQALGLPKSVWSRQPFPGPGLFLRIVGVPITAERLELVRWADAEVRRILTTHGLYDQISQLVVAYLGVNTVGVKGDKRVYAGAICVRAVQTVDFMTAHGVWFPEEVVQEIKRVITAHPMVVRVFFDPTDKPPGTTEPE